MPVDKFRPTLPPHIEEFEPYDVGSRRKPRQLSIGGVADGAFKKVELYLRENPPKFGGTESIPAALAAPQPA